MKGREAPLMEKSRKVSARKGLMDTLEQLLHKKPFQKISVNELCERTLVSRTAFYANFRDKYHLLACCLESKTAAVNSLIETHSTEEFLSVILDFIQKDPRFFYNTFGAHPEEEILDIMFGFFERQITSFLEDQTEKGLVLPCPAEIVSSFCVGGLTVSTLRWIKSNYKTPKEELAACQYTLLRSILSGSQRVP